MIVSSVGLFLVFVVILVPIIEFAKMNAGLMHLHIVELFTAKTHFSARCTARKLSLCVGSLNKILQRLCSWVKI